MKHSAVLSHIRQLCSLGLRAEGVAPALLRALHDAIPADSNAFFWVDEQYEISNVYAERVLPRDLMGLYFREFYRNPQSGFKQTLQKIALRPYGVATANLPPSFYRSDYYNLVWRDLNAHHVLYAAIRSEAGLIGQLSIYRAPKDPQFTQEDEQTLASLSRYLGHGLSSQLPDHGIDWEHAYHDSEDTGLVIADLSGRIQWLSPEGRKLMLMAFCPEVRASTVLSTDDSVLPPELMRLCHQLRELIEGHAAPPPATSLENQWGRFAFRAYWLEQYRGGNSLIGISVQHQELRALALLARLKSTTLSEKQKQVILLLANGESHAAIGADLNVTINTANYHVKQVYEKLDIHSRSEMLAKLLMPH
jgi:DNA-binding CsgD family transcriptional regulator